jgi:hypothetical protein
MAAIPLAAGATDSGDLELLHSLRIGLTEAQSLPFGARPAPPKVALTSLVGVTRGEISAALGMPSFCEPDHVANCAEEIEWAYRWGPSDRPLMEKNGSIIVTTGGPFLLKFRFEKDSVVRAFWEGQR